MQLLSAAAVNRMSDTEIAWALFVSANTVDYRPGASIATEGSTRVAPSTIRHMPSVLLGDLLQLPLQLRSARQAPRRSASLPHGSVTLRFIGQDGQITAPGSGIVFASSGNITVQIDANVEAFIRITSKDDRPGPRRMSA